MPKNQVLGNFKNHARADKDQKKTKRTKPAGAVGRGRYPEDEFLAVLRQENIGRVTPPLPGRREIRMMAQKASSESLRVQNQVLSVSSLK